MEYHILDSPSLLAKDVDQSFVYPVSESGVFLMDRSRGISSARSTTLSPALHALTHVVKRTVGSDSTALLEVPVLANDRGDTTSTQPSGSSTDQLGQVSEKVSFFQGSL
jgi:hypothetical protein